MENPPDGWGGVKWGDRPEELGDDKVCLGRSPDTYEKVYKKDNDVNMLGEIPLTAIEYSFINDQLFSVDFISTEVFLKDSFYAYLVDRYGEPFFIDNRGEGGERFLWGDHEFSIILDTLEADRISAIFLNRKIYEQNTGEL
jgi:hypothetical protein